MELSKLRMPNLKADGMKTGEKFNLLTEYLFSLEKNLRFVLNNLEEDNLGEELAKKLSAASQVAGAGNSEQPKQKQIDFQSEIQKEVKAALQNIYPVGSIYMSVNETNPGKLFGGTWEQIKDKFLLAAGDTYEAGSEGGEAEHQLTIDEMPSHNHNFKTKPSASAAGTAYSRMASNGDETTTLITNAGGDQPHNNMPPYLAVNIWKRTA